MESKSVKEHICKTCLESFQAHPNRKYCDKCQPYIEPEKRQREIERRSKKITDYRRRIKVKSVEFLGGKCVLCGYSKCLAALDIHHRDHNEKEFSISKKSTLSWERIKTELIKCVLLCKNCHAEAHAGYHSYQTLISVGATSTTPS